MQLEKIQTEDMRLLKKSQESSAKTHEALDGLENAFIECEKKVTEGNAAFTQQLESAHKDLDNLRSQGAAAAFVVLVAVLLNFL